MAEDFAGPEPVVGGEGPAPEGVRRHLHVGPVLLPAVAGSLGFDTDAVRVQVVRFQGHTRVVAEPGSDDVEDAGPVQEQVRERARQVTAARFDRARVRGRGRGPAARVVVDGDAVDVRHRTVATGFPPVAFLNVQAGVS